MLKTRSHLDVTRSHVELPQPRPGDLGRMNTIGFRPGTHARRSIPAPTQPTTTARTDHRRTFRCAPNIVAYARG